MKKKINIKNILLFVGFLIALNFMYPAPITTKFNLQVGMIAPRDIIAPYTFYIKKNKTEIQEETERARQAIFPVLRKIPVNISQQLNDFFQKLEELRQNPIPLEKKRAELISRIPSLTDQSTTVLLLKDYSPIRDTLFNLINEYMDVGIVESMASISSPTIVIMEQELPISLQNFIDYREIPRLIKERTTNSFGNRASQNATVEIGSFFIKPNLKFDPVETEKRKEFIMAQLKTTKGVIQKGEMIVRAHDIITPEAIEKLNSLPQYPGKAKISLALGRNIIYIVAIIVLFLCLYFFNLPLINEFKRLLLLVILLCVAIGMTSTAVLLNLSTYLIPVATFGILASLLLGTQTGIIGVLTLTILLSAYTAGDFGVVLLSLFAGSISVFSATDVKRSFDFYKPVVYLAITYGCTALGIELLKLSSFLPLVKSVGWAAMGGVTASFIAFGLLPLFESIFKITTPITLLEYADFNHPMMQRLATYAPGTYHHSITTANLAEAGARAINANPLLARVGAYYHDVGKLKKPNYFIENQSHHPRSKLKPELNALVVISHVKEGIELAKSEDFPQEIIDIISSHHGTTMASIFYEKAKELNVEGNVINELDFQYTGPLPKTKEAAIVMLADAIEATSRSVEEPTPVKLKSVIEETIQSRLEEKQLSMANLSLDELRKIENSFLPILMGVFHPRINYEKHSSTNPK